MSDAKTPRDDAPELRPCPFCGNRSAYYGASVRCTSFSCNASMSPRWTKDVVGSAKGDFDARLALAKADTTLRWNDRRADQPARVGVAQAWEEGFNAASANTTGFAVNPYSGNEPLLPTEAGAEPVAWRYPVNHGTDRRWNYHNSSIKPPHSGCEPLYATPPTASPDAALVKALKDATAALAKFVDTRRKHREPYDTPLSAYDRATNLLAAQSTRPAPQAVAVQEAAFHPTHQHVKRGTEYQEMARGRLQTDVPLTDYADLVAYRDDDGVWWFRPPAEFDDGRFRALAGERG